MDMWLLALSAFADFMLASPLDAEGEIVQCWVGALLARASSARYSADLPPRLPQENRLPHSARSKQSASANAERANVVDAEEVAIVNPQLREATGIANQRREVARARIRGANFSLAATRGISVDSSLVQNRKRINDAALVRDISLANKATDNSIAANNRHLATRQEARLAGAEFSAFVVEQNIAAHRAQVNAGIISSAVSTGLNLFQSIPSNWGGGGGGGNTYDTGNIGVWGSGINKGNAGF